MIILFLRKDFQQLNIEIANAFSREPSNNYHEEEENTVHQIVIARVLHFFVWYLQTGDKDILLRAREQL